MASQPHVDEIHATRRNRRAERRERRAVSYCDIWDMVAPGESCPACDDDFAGRLARAAAG